MRLLLYGGILTAALTACLSRQVHLEVVSEVPSHTVAVLPERIDIPEPELELTNETASDDAAYPQPTGCAGTFGTPACRPDLDPG